MHAILCSPRGQSELGDSRGERAGVGNSLRERRKIILFV